MCSQSDNQLTGRETMKQFHSNIEGNQYLRNDFILIGFEYRRALPGEL